MKSFLSSPEIDSSWSARKAREKFTNKNRGKKFKKLSREKAERKPIKMFRN
jgi:hypothetical protein